MSWEGLNPPYSTIVADPPWPYPEGFTTQSRTAERWTAPELRRWLPYSSMTVADIEALPVVNLIGASARLFLWTTNRYLGAAFGVLSAWGASYKQTLVWHKLDGNMGGSIAPNSAEFLLVAIWGEPPVLTKAPSSVIAHAQTKQHSRKPPAFADLIEATSPGPYVELFARQPRLGWDSWGLGYELAADQVGEPG